MNCLKFILISFCIILLELSSLGQQPGTLDYSFGDSGKVATPENTTVESSALQDDGKILLAGDDLIIRYLNKGTVDESFGEKGLINTDPYYLYSINVANDGSIIAIGSQNVGANKDIIILKYNADGLPDQAFGNNGISIIDFGENEDVYSSCVSSDGRIIITGTISDASMQSIRGLIVRCSADGTVDKNFGKNGKYEINIGNSAYLVNVKLQPDGKLITTGYHSISNYIGIIARFTPDGLPDSTFNKTGIAIFDIADSQEMLSAVGLQSDGKIIAGGTVYSNYQTDPKMIAVRYNTDGSLDKSFGSDGYKIVAFKLPSHNGDMIIQKNDKIVLAGSVFVEFTDSLYDLALTRLTADGSIDSNFGKEGEQITDFGGVDNCRNILLQKDGKLIQTGNRGYNNNALILARYYGDPLKQQGPLSKIKRWIKNHILNWQGLQDNDVAYYSVEQSNGVNGFKEIGRVKAVNRQSSNVKGNEQRTMNNEQSVYSYNISNAYAQSSQLTAQRPSYYRIRAVSNDGSNVVSDVISDENFSSITISPNPVKDVLTISGLPSNQKSTINIISRNGNIIQSAVCNGSVYNINVARLHSGLYNAQGISNGKTQTVKFVKE